MQRHINYFIYFGHVFYNTAIAMLFFMISVPYVSKTKEILGNQHKPAFIFDMGGVLALTDKQVAARSLGLPLLLKRMFWHFQGVSGSHIQTLYYQTLDRVAAEILNQEEMIMPLACDQEGKVLPVLMRLWLAGKVHGEEIKETALSVIQQHNDWFSNETEQQIIENLISFIFTPELFIQTQYIPDKTINFIKQLKIAGYKLYILSNWDRDSFALLRQRYAEFFDLFDGLVISGFEGFIKPDREIYRILLQRYNLSSEQCLFIDDQEENTNAAQLEHIATILCKNPQTIFRVLGDCYLS